MRFIALLVICGGVAACHDHEHDGYSNYQACYDEHTGAESLPVQDAIIVCCLDHEIDGVMPACGATAADCSAYLTNNLLGPTPTEISAACDEYIVQKNQ
jgi:hypothetical protein